MIVPITIPDCRSEHPRRIQSAAGVRDKDEAQRADAKPEPDRYAVSVHLVAQIPNPASKERKYSRGHDLSSYSVKDRQLVIDFRHA